MLVHADVYMPTMVACGSMTVSTALGCKSACSLEMRRACFASHAAISCPPCACTTTTTQLDLVNINADSKKRRRARTTPECRTRSLSGLSCGSVGSNDPCQRDDSVVTRPLQRAESRLLK